MQDRDGSHTDDGSAEDIELQYIYAQPAAPSRRHLEVPNLRVDTSNLDHDNESVSDTSVSEPPQSAILGIAKLDNLKIDNWLPEQSQRNSKISPASSLNSFGHRREYSHASSVNSIQQSPQKGMLQTGHGSETSLTSPELRGVASPVRFLKPLDLRSPPRSRPQPTAVPQIFVSVERTFQNSDYDTPVHNPVEDHDADINNISTLDLGASVISPRSDASSNPFDNPPSPSSAAASTVNLRPKRDFTTRRRVTAENVDKYNLSLSGAAFLTQHDVLDPESYADEVDELQSHQSYDDSSSFNASTVSFDPTVVDENKLPIREPVGRTLFFFYPNNPLRRYLYELFKHDWIAHFEFVLTLAQMIALCIECRNPFGTSGGMPVVVLNSYMYFYESLYAIFALLFAGRAIAYGVITNEILSWREFRACVFWCIRGVLHLATFGALKTSKTGKLSSNKQTYAGCVLRSSWGRVEFLSMIFFWTFVGLIRNSTVYSLELIIAGLGHLRILGLLDYILYTRFVIRVLKRAVPLLQNVFLFIGYFLIIWAVVGVLSFNGSLRRVCIYDEHITQQNCGSWLDPETLEVMPYVYLDTAAGAFQSQNTKKGYTCPVGSKCVELRAYPSFGTDNDLADMSFDNIFNSLEIVFIMMSANGFTPIMYDIIDSEYLVSSLFFISGVLILGIWLMNLLVAVMVSSYGSIKENFITTSEAKDPVVSFFKRILRRILVPKALYNTDVETQQAVEEQRDQGRWLLQSSEIGKIYSNLSPLLALLVLADLVYQAAKAPPDAGLFWWEVALAIIFGVDILFRFYIYLPYWRYFFFSFGNLFDVVLAVANCIILAFHDDYDLYNWLTIFQLLRIQRLVALIKYSRVFWIQVFGNFKALASLTMFFFLCTLLCTLIATKMLRGQFSMETDGSLNVSSFYDLAASYISMQQIASTENWTDVLFYVTENVSRPGDNVVGLACMGILLCSWLFFANFLVFNLFLGIMSENLHGAIVNKREEQVRQFASEIQKRSMATDGPRFGRVLKSFSSLDDDDAERPVSFKDKVLAWPLRWLSPVRETETVFKPIRANMERKLVIEFLESHGDLESFTGGKIGRSFLNLEGDDTEVAGFELWKKFSVFKFCKSMAYTVFGWFHNFPSDYRKFLYERLEKRAYDEGVDRKKAYVEEIFEYNTHHLATLNEYCSKHPNFDKSLLLFSVRSKIRQFFQRLFHSSSGTRRSNIYPKNWVGFYVRLFFVLATISVVVVTCIDTPIRRLQENTKTQWDRDRYVDIVFGTIFTFEFVGKVIADGFHFTPNAYTRNWWNVLDFIVLISIWTTFVSDVLAQNWSRYFRALMALRALRLITIFQQSELLLESIFTQGFQNVLGATVIALSILIPYSVWGKNIFHGRLEYCNDDNTNYLSNCTGEYVATAFDNFELLAPRVVTNTYFSYDNFWDALMIQFGVLSLEGWIDVLDAVTSITQPGEQQSTYASKGNAVYPILYNYIGAVLIMSMLITVIIRNYSLTIGTAYLTDEQLSWIDVKHTLKMVTPTPRPPVYPPGSLREKLLHMIPTWITSVEVWTLMLVTIDMSVYFYPLNGNAQTVYYAIILASSLLLFCISTLKLLILKPLLFCHNLWNVFALLSSLFAVVIILITMLLPPAHESVPLSLSRLSFICLLLLWIPRIKKLYQFYSIGTAAIAKIGMLLFAWGVLYVTYAIALNQSFGAMKLGANSTWAQNFRSIPKALIALFTMSCGEGWNEFLVDFTMAPPYCVQDSENSECGIPGFAYFMFITWNLLSMYVFANVFISVVCEACWYVYRSSPVNIRELDILNLLDSWQRFDPKGTGYIRVNDIYRFLRFSQGYFSLSIFSEDAKYSVQRILEVTQDSVRAVADPYYVDMEAIHAYLADMPVQEYRDKRSVFELFVAHAQSQAYPVPGGRGIRFHKLMLMFPLYKDMNPEETLSLKEFLQLKVQLHEARVTLAGEFVARMWRVKRAHEKRRMAHEPGFGYDQSIRAPKPDDDSIYWAS